MRTSPRIVAGYELVLLVVTAVALGLVTYNRVRLGGSATPSDGLLGLAVVLLIPWLATSRRRFVALPRWLYLSAGLFAAASLLAALFPAAPSKAALYFPGGPLSLLPADAEGDTPSNLAALLRLEVALLLVPFVVVHVGTSWRRISQLANAWLAGLLIAGVVGVVAYLGDIHVAGIIGGAPGAEVTRIKGFAVHPNVFGDTAAVALPTATAFWFSSSGRYRWYYAFVIVTLVGAVGVSGSRAAVLGVIVGIFIFAVMDRASRGLLIRVGLAVIALGLVVGLAALNSVPVLQRIGGGSDVNVANDERLAIYSKVWSEIVDRPIVGHGFEYIRGAHDIYLQVLHAGGIIALFGLLTIVFGVVRTAYRSGASGSEEILVHGFAASSLTWLLGTGVFEPAIYDRYLYVPIALLIACWAVAKREAQVDSQPSTVAESPQPRPEGASSDATSVAS